MSEQMSCNALVFGSGGALGGAIQNSLIAQGFKVFTAGSGDGQDLSSHLVISYESTLCEEDFQSLPKMDAVVWAQGINCNDSITTFDPTMLNKLWQANVQFTATCLSALLKANKLNSPSRLAIVSSIWQLESRPGKFSYTISKAALQGMVKSCALDLGPLGILINAVLPGVVDTPMTRSHLSEEQMASITKQTALQRLAEPSDIGNAVAFLVGPSNRCITGQFLTVDGGFIGFKHY